MRSAEQFFFFPHIICFWLQCRSYFNRFPSTKLLFFYHIRFVYGYNADRISTIIAANISTDSHHCILRVHCFAFNSLVHNNGLTNSYYYSTNFKRKPLNGIQWVWPFPHMLVHTGEGSEGMWTMFCTVWEKHTGLLPGTTADIQIGGNHLVRFMFSLRMAIFQRASKNWLQNTYLHTIIQEIRSAVLCQCVLFIWTHNDNACSISLFNFLVCLQYCNMLQCYMLQYCL